MALSFSVFNRFKAIDDVTAPVNKMSRSVGRFGQTASKEFRRADRASNVFRRSLTSLKGQLASFLAVSTASMAFVDAIRTGAEFEQTLVTAAAKFGGAAALGTKNFKDLEAAAVKAGKTTEWTASQAAEGLNFLAMAGFDVKQSIAALPGVIDLATASGLDLGRASDIATDALGAFNLATKDAAQLQKNLSRVTDVMAKTVTTANVDMEQLFETFTYAAPPAAALGASIETVSAMAGVLGNAGIKASIAGTTLRSVFLRLAATTPEAEKALKSLGVSVKDSSGNFRDVLDIFDDLGKSLEGLGTAQKQEVLKKIFGKIPISGVNILLQKGADGLRAYRKQLEDASGATQKMADMIRGTVAVRFKLFVSALESLNITIFKTLGKDISLVVFRITELVKATDTWLKLNGTKVAAVFGRLVDVLGLLAGIIGTLITYTSNFAKTLSFMMPVLKAFLALWVAYRTITLAAAAATWVLNAAMAANPLGLFAVTVVSVIAAVKALRDNWNYLVDDFKRLGAGVLNGFVSVLSKILGMAASLGSFIGFDTSKLSAMSQQLANIKTNVINGEVIVSPNAGTAQTIRQIKENTSNVRVDFANVPQGTAIEQTGAAPGFDLNIGFAGI